MTNCTVECTSVPDGFASLDLTRLRLSVVLVPAALNHKNPAGGPAVDLEQWPTQVPRLSFQVWAGPSKSAVKLVGIVPAAIAFEDDQTASISPHAQSWWSRLWQNPADLDAYLSLLAGGGSAVTTGPDTTVEGYDYLRLHQGAIDRTLEEFAAAVASDMVRREGKFNDLEGLTQRAARNPNDPLVRITRALKWSALSSRPVPASAGAVQPPPRGMVKGATIHPDVARALDPQSTEVLLRADSAGAPAPFTATTAEKNDDDFERAMRNDKDLEAEGANLDALDPKLEYAHQVIGTLQAHPALRKFARQIADIPLDTSALRAAFPSPSYS